MTAYMHTLRCTGALIAWTALSGCVPQDTSALPVPAHVSTAALFDCAGAVVHDLHRGDARWNARVTRHDPAGGVFETGAFGEANVMGYRVRLVRRDAAPKAVLSVRAAGPYFTDLGAERALSGFRSTLAACIARAGPSPRPASGRP